MEMLEAARREYHDDQVQPAALDVLQPGNAYLQDLVDSFLKKLRGQANKTQVVCFFELKSSNVGRIVGKQDRTVGLADTAYDARAKKRNRGSWSASTLAVSIFPSRRTSGRCRGPTST